MATKTVIVTGSNNGIGYYTAIEVARDHQWHVIVATRNKAAGEQTVKDVIAATKNPHVEQMTIDLASLDSIRNFASEFSKKKLPPLYSLVNNAGIQVVSKTEFTKDGYEATFGVNHLGGFLLSHLLLPHFPNEGGRIIFVTSDVHDPEVKLGMIPPPRYETARKLAFVDVNESTDESIGVIGRRRYSTSKLCNILCTYGFAQRLKEKGIKINVNAWNPGLTGGTSLTKDWGFFANILTSVVSKMPFVRHASTAGKELAEVAVGSSFADVNEKYIDRLEIKKSAKITYDTSLQNDLWTTSVELAKLTEKESPLTK